MIQRPSEIDGEQIEDSIRIIGSYSDVIVVRHPEAGGVQRAAFVSPVPLLMPGTEKAGSIPGRLCWICTPSKRLNCFLSAGNNDRVATEKKSSECRCERPEEDSTIH
jgi:hypothetical protein